jgi:hypothetical protein
LAFDSVANAATELQTRAAEAFPATGHFLGRVVYKTSYAVAFGVTFPVMMVVRIVPKDNAIVHGLVDGAIAARDRVDEWRGEFEEEEHDAEDDLAHALDNGSADAEDAPKRSTHRRTKAKRGTTRKTAARGSSRKKS